MCLLRFLDDLERELDGILVWDATAISGRRILCLQERAKSIEAILAQSAEHYRAIHQKTQDLEQQLTFLAECVQIFHHVGDSSRAWQLALQLDRARQRLQQHRLQLQDASSVKREHDATLKQIQDELRRLSEPERD